MTTINKNVSWSQLVIDDMIEILEDNKVDEAGNMVDRLDTLHKTATIIYEYVIDNDNNIKKYNLIKKQLYNAKQPKTIN